MPKPGDQPRLLQAAWTTVAATVSRKRVRRPVLVLLLAGVPLLFFFLAGEESGRFADDGAMVGTLVTLVLVLLLGSGLIEEDFASGRIRLWAQKPADPAAFYGMQLLCTVGLLFSGILYTMGWAFALSAAFGHDAAPLGGALLGDLLLGFHLLCVAFLLSGAGLARDAEVSIVLFVLASLQGVVPDGTPEIVRRGARLLLPQVAEIDRVATAALPRAGGGAFATPLLTVLAYSTFAVVIGLLAVRYRLNLLPGHWGGGD